MLNQGIGCLAPGMGFKLFRAALSIDLRACTNIASPAAHIAQSTTRTSQPIPRTPQPINIFHMMNILLDNRT